MEVEVDLGYVDDHSVIFRGLTTQVDADFPDDGVPQVTLRAFDNSIRMGLRRRSRPPWTNIDLQGIVSQIATEYDFSMQDIALPPGGNPTYTGNGIRQREKTDLAFLHDLAEAQRCKVFVDTEDFGDVFTFKAEQMIMDAEPASTVYYGRCGVENRLLSFSVNSDVTQRRRPQVYASIDPETGRETEAQRQVEPPRDVSGSPFDENLAELGRRYPTRAAAVAPLLNVATQARESIFAKTGDEEREIAAGLHSAQTLRQQTAPQASTVTEGITGQGVTEGNKDLRAKRNIRIEAVGGRFSGKWYLTQVRHVVDRSGYRTHFTCSR
jgi:phage protein D